MKWSSAEESVLKRPPRRGTVVAPATAKPAVAREAPDDGVEVLLVCTAGGHVIELFALRAAWRGLESAWVTMDRAEARWLLQGERVVFAHPQEARSVTN